MNIGKRRALFIWISLLALLTVFFYYAGVMLVKADKPEKADLIIVLMGSGIRVDILENLSIYATIS